MKIIPGEDRMQQGSSRKSADRLNEEPAESVFLPNFCSIRSVFIVVLSTELLAIVLSLAATDELGGFLQELSLVSLMAQWIALSTVALLCMFKGILRRMTNRMAGLLAWACLMLVSLIVWMLASWLNAQEGMLLATDQPAVQLLKSLGISAIVGLVVLHYLHILYRWKLQAAAENAARLQALNSRIRPHFLFNSMNTIASLTRTNPVQAEEVVEDLADLFRTSLGDVNRHSTVQDELQLARQYLSIEQHRLGERLQVVWDLAAMPESALLPPLTLQPLLENAVYHGIEPSTKGGMISITGRYQKNRLNLSIRNTLPEQPRTTRRKGNQLAIENIRQRLIGMYADSASLTESHIDDEYQIRLVIPHPRGLG